MDFSNVELKDRIASGPYADVYKYDQWAVKVFKEKRTKVEILYEALVNAQVEATGLSVPRVRDVTRLPNKQWILATQYVEGNTLLQTMKNDMKHLEKYVELLVDLQMEVHSKDCPKLIKLKDKLMQEIGEAQGIDGVVKYDLMTRLEGMPKHKKLVHGNFAPSNVIITPDGKPVIVDWIEASQGNASYGTAKTYLLLQFELKEAAEMYLERFCQKSKTDKKYVQEWLPIAACAQLKYAKPEESDLLMRWLDVVQYV